LYKLIQQLLFMLPAEASHNVALTGMRWNHRLGLDKLVAANIIGLAEPKELLGLTFPHRVGLAAGLDKSAEYFDALAALGFGFVEVGTLTPRPQDGNPKPRLFRLKQDEAIINRMGFNNRGIEYGVNNLRRKKGERIVGVNIGKNFDTPVEQAADDYRLCMRACYEVADYITVNISSPNTPGLRSLQHGDELRSLLALLKEEQRKLQERHSCYTPMLVKLAPDLTEADIKSTCEQIMQAEMDGIIATNTTLARTGVSDNPLAAEQGGLSGAPLSIQATEVITQIRSEVGPQLPLIGVGGIMSAADAKARLEAGADLLQLYSGFIYHGPELISDILRAIHDA